MKQVEIITIGDELLIGQVVDTNSAWMAQRLNEWGYEVRQITSVHDSAEQITEALTLASRNADIVLLTGGLGPTKDDITKHVLCDYFGTTLSYRNDIHDFLLQHYAQRPDVLNRLTDAQCLFPVDAELIPNRVGSAQVMAFRQTVDGRLVLFISMPGVPREMEWVMLNGVHDYLSRQMPTAEITHRTIRTSGIAESSLAIILESWENALPSAIHLAYLPKDGRIRLRLSGYDVAPALVDAELEKLTAILTDHHITFEDANLPNLPN